jgi:two-component system sensor histidine kinase KdpD
VISGLTQRIRAQGDAARERENRTASLYAMSRELAASASAETLYAIAVRHLADVFECAVAILVPGPGGLTVAFTGDLAFRPDEKELAVAEWAWTHERSAGLSTDTLPSAQALYVPLRSGPTRVGVVGIRPLDPRRLADPRAHEWRQLLETFLGQIATAFERATLALAAQRAEVQIETEQLKNSLLSSVSHDLRTPLAVITGSAATLADDGLDAGTRRDLLATIQEEGDRLNRLVRNLLDMTRLEGGALVVKKEWQDVEEVIGSALTRLEESLRGRPVETNVPRDLPMAPFDPILVEQVLINLLENAIKYTPDGSAIEVSARPAERAIEVSVSDRGPGVPVADVEKIFEKFYRASAGKGGAGLGLTICRGIVTAHGGKLWVDPRPGGGSSFRFTIPLEGAPPAVDTDEEGPLPSPSPAELPEGPR